MTPSLFDLPLRLGDTVALGQVLIDVLGNKPGLVTDEQRNRCAARSSALQFEAMRVLLPSLERDPVHPSAYYVCVDGSGGEPWLLRVATAQTPSSGLFPKSILIGRTFAGPHEVVLNALPFGPTDHERVAVYSEQVNKAFLPKVFGAKPVVRITSETPAESFPKAFEALKSVMKANGQTLGCFAMLPGQDVADFYDATVWSAVRSGMRDGYGIEAYPANAEEAKGVTSFTRFGVRGAEAIAAVRSVKRGPFDSELITTAAEAESALTAMREEGYSVQSVALEDKPAEGLAEVVAQYRAVLNTREIRVTPEMTREEIEALLG